MLLACIADDFTGATDLANMLVRGGMRTVQTIGVPESGQQIDADAVVVSLKSRTVDAQEAIDQSLQACRWLQRAGAKQFFFKYCSTFDSTPKGNIGPVAEALMHMLGASFAVACPAFPENGRSIYRGHLFVGDVLLNESGMENHPLTPMRDANLVRVLQAQSQGAVGLAGHEHVQAGPGPLKARLQALQAQGVSLAIVDAISDKDLHTIAQACEDHILITGGSGVALGLPANFERAGLLRHKTQAASLPSIAGPALVVAGSCSKATQAQVAHWLQSRPGFRIDPLALHQGGPVVEQALAFSRAHLSQEPVLVYATSTPQEVTRVQHQIGTERAGQLVEQALADIASALVAQGVRKLICAGGETSGAIVRALGVHTLQVGPQIDPGVPWMTTQRDSVTMAIALKSGNFGTVDFFEKALNMLQQA